MNKVANSAPPTDAPTWSVLVGEAGRALRSANEARWIAEEVARRAGIREGAVHSAAPNTATRAEFERLIARRISGEPLQHLLGHWPFRTVDLRVDSRALIPRPETEVVVECALAELTRIDAPLVVELGTGSGAIACAIVSEHPGASVIATDISTDAIELARTNRDRLRPDDSRRIRMFVGDWFDALPGDLRDHVDLVVSNPPYVAEHEWTELDPVVRDFEPRVALVGGAEGTEALARVISGARDVVTDAGVLVVEIGATQAEAATSLARAMEAREVEVLRDLSGRDRVLRARW